MGRQADAALLSRLRAQPVERHVHERPRSEGKHTAAGRGYGQIWLCA